MSLVSTLSDASEPDYEAEFYKILGRMQDDVDAMTVRLKKDTFDATGGPQVGITAQGNVGILMVVNQASAKMLYDAWQALLDHECEAGLQSILEYFWYQGLLLENLLPHLDAEVQQMEFFTHGE